MKRMMSVFAFVAIAAVPGVARGQLLDLRLGADGPAFTYGRASARLDGMGGMVVAVPDETNEISMFDFGDNVAGILSDRDAWSSDFWARKGDRTDHSEPGQRLSRGNDEEGLLFVSRLNENTLALGALVSHARGNLSGQGEDPRDLTGTVASGLYAQSFGPRLTVGARLGVDEENEALNTSYVFAIHHDSNTTQGGAAASYHVLDWLDLGGTADYVSSTIDGVSSDSFHRDLYTWERPETQVSGTALAHFSKVTAGLVARRSALNGREQVEVNWSDRFPLNPTHQNVTWRGPTMKETLDHSVLLGRVDWRPLEGTMVAALAGFGSSKNKVVTKTDFESSLSPVDEDEKSLSAGAGASRLFMDGRFLGAAEVRYDRSSVDGRLERSTYTVKETHTEASVGAEYFWTRTVLVRGGLVRSARSEDTVVGKIRHGGNGLTVGVGYVPSGGLLQVDAAYRYQNEPPTSESKTLAQKGGLEVGKLEVQTFTISARLLF